MTDGRYAKSRRGDIQRLADLDHRTTRLCLSRDLRDLLLAEHRLPHGLLGLNGVMDR